MTNLYSIGSSLGAVQDGLDAASGDLSASQVKGHKGSRSFFISNSVKTSAGTVVAGITQRAKKLIDAQGSISASAVATNMAINGDGFFAVSRAGSDEMFLAKDGSFSVTHDGTLQNEKGARLRGWRLDNMGRRPGEAGNPDTRASSLLSSLEDVNIKGLSGRARATEKIMLDLRLDASAEVIKGAGQTFSFGSFDDLNSFLRDNDVIAPSGDNIRQGDTLKIQIGNADAVEYVYGGVSRSFNISKMSIFGAATSSAKFTIGDTASGIQAKNGDKLIVRVGTEPAAQLKVVGGTPNAANLEFNSLSSLAAALNQVKGLTARITGNTLHVASKDGISAVTFDNQGDTDFVSYLGLSNIDAPAAGVKRYATLGQLRTYLKEQKGVRVEKNDNGGIDITTLDPSESITFTTTAERKNAISHVTATQTDPATAAGAKALTTLKIISANNGLKAGDYVRITGLAIPANGVYGVGGGAVTDGTYLVTAADDGSFSISGTSLINCGGIGNTRTSKISAAATWQKITGTKAAATDFDGADTIARAAAGGGRNDVTITHAGHSLILNDVIYINGLGLANTIAVPDGYYRVSAVPTANDFTISVLEIGGGAAVLGGAMGAAATGASFSKVGTAAAAPNTIEASTAFEAGAEADRVKVKMPNHGFSVGDYVALGGDSILVGGTDEITGLRYEIVSRDNDSFEIEVGTTAAAHLIALDSIPGGNYINYFSKFNKTTSLSQKKDAQSLDSVYDPLDITKNLASGNIEGTWEQPITVFDSQGISHNLRIAFAKINTNKWAVEIYATKNSQDEYDIEADNGMIASSTLTFGADGTLTREGLAAVENISIQWKNGTGESNIKIEWGAAADDESTAVFTNGGVKQVNGKNAVFLIDQDGYAPGKFTGVVLDGTTGRLRANFDNGRSFDVYEIPICFVAAPNELEDIGSGLYRATNGSGEIYLKQSGTDGVGTLVGGAYEASNVDSTSKIIEMTELSVNYGYLGSAFAMQKETEKDLLRRL